MPSRTAFSYPVICVSANSCSSIKLYYTYSPDNNGVRKNVQIVLRLPSTVWLNSSAAFKDFRTLACVVSSDRNWMCSESGIHAATASAGASKAMRLHGAQHVPLNSCASVRYLVIHHALLIQNVLLLQVVSLFLSLPMIGIHKAFL
jgi:hypothetical protein